MFRIVDGMAYEGKPSPDRWEERRLDLGNGHREVSLTRCIDWQERGLVSPDAKPMTDEEEGEKREANRKRAARRGKTRVRRLCKAQGLDTMLTLTYRGLQTDLELCKRHFTLLRKRLANLLGGWCYVAAFEEQKRGAWHVHVAMHRFPPTFVRNGCRVKSWNVVRAMWRDITKEWGGNIDVGRNRWKLRSPAKCAAYLSKYMLKAWADGADWANRYLASRAEIPQAVVRRLERCQGHDLREAMAAALEWASEGRQLVTTWLSRFGDTLFVVGEAPPHPPQGGSVLAAV